MAPYKLPAKDDNLVGEATRRTGSIRSCCGTIRRRVLLMLWPTVAAVFLSGLSWATPYHFSTGAGTSREPIADLIGHTPTGHSEVLAAGFGFQAAGASSITVRTYEVQTGAMLSEDSFDVSVKEEGAAEHDENKGRIFAGGIGIDGQGNSRFMLRVYDAETGRFLWEGQLNLLKVGEAGAAKAKATIIPGLASVSPASERVPKAFQALFSVRAVNPLTGRLVWQDQFAPGSRKRAGVAGVSCRGCFIRPVNEPIGHIFDLVVRTYDRTSGKLLWEDSFEQLERIEEPAVVPETNAYPQAIPFWSSDGVSETEVYETALR